MCYNSINHQDYFELLKSCKEEGLNVNFLPHLAWHTGCMMQNRNSYIVGPEGELYKCWNDVNHPEKIVGNINEKELSNLPLLMHYMVEATPFAVKECKECGVFPSCCGGCGSWISRNLLNGADYSVCPFYKNPHLLEESLMLYLDNQDNDNTDMSV